MQVISLFLILSGAVMSWSSFAQSVCHQEYGQTTCSSGVVDNVTANGVTKLTGTQVKEHTLVNGMLQATDVQLGVITMNGTAVIRNSVIKDAAIFNGVLTAKNVKFLSLVELASNHASFHKCDIKSITMRSPENKPIELKLSASHVKGDITFKQGNGVVYACQKTKIDGKVQGGKIINHC